MQFTDSILLVTFLVSINFLFNRLKDFSCGTQRLFSENVFAKHSFNVAAVFFVLVLFMRSEPLHPLIIIVLTFAIYAFFILVSKSDSRFLVGFLVCMVVVFYLEAWKNYQKKKKEEVKQITQYQLTVQIIGTVLILIGVLVYMGQHSREYKKNWNWSKFWFGLPSCSENGIPIKKDLVGDLKDGLKRLIR